jgi:hypothetical protein
MSQNAAKGCCWKMQTQAFEVLISIFMAGVAVGFAAGFAVRASISRHRRAKAERNRLILQ